LAGEPAGRVLSPETKIATRAPTRSGCSEGNTAEAEAQAESRLCGVRGPRHAGKHHARESGEPGFARTERKAGCIGKSEDISQ
jgi:hypothetical protein